MMSEAGNPYGDGTASIKIRKILEDRGDFSVQQEVSLVEGMKEPIPVYFAGFFE